MATCDEEQDEAAVAVDAGKKLQTSSEPTYSHTRSHGV